MHILQNGIPKSGNLWLYQILSEILDLSGIPDASYIRHHPCYPGLLKMDFDVQGMQGIDTLEIEPHRCFAVVRQTFREAIEDLDSYIAATRLVWTHASWNSQSSDRVYRKFDKLVYIIRDPRDGLVSMSHFQFTPYKKLYYPAPDMTPEQWLERAAPWWIQRWKAHVSDHLSQLDSLNIYPVFFERLIKNPADEIKGLCHYLGLELSDNQIETVRKRTTSENMRKKAPHHVRQAQSGNWGTSISPATQKLIWDEAGELLGQLGYNKSPTETNLHLPTFPPG